MGTKYTTQTISGYNTSPPSDDGATNAANEITWQRHIDKIGDPLETFIDAVQSALETHLDEPASNHGTNYDITAADYMKTMNAQAAITINLPDATTVGTGFIVRVKNSHSADITVGRLTGANTIEGTAADDTLQAGVAATYVTTSSADGFLKISATDNQASIVAKLAGSTLSTDTLESTVATGTAPLAVASTTVVSNLNTQYLHDGTQERDGAYYLDRTNHTGSLGLPVGDVNIYTSSDTWSKPDDLVKVKVTVVGGGGGGGNSPGFTGGGGGGGGSAITIVLAASLGATETVTVGSGGGISVSGGQSVFGAHSVCGGGNPGSDGDATEGAGGSGGTATGTLAYTGQDGVDGAAGGLTMFGVAGSGGRALTSGQDGFVIVEEFY